MIPERKEVVIIGNGPSAITLSYFLDGNWPYYSKEHPNEELHARLQSLQLFFKDQDEVVPAVASHSSSSCILSSLFSCPNSRHASSSVPAAEKSLARSPLELICNGLEGRSINPVSVLLDTLQHPEADFGSDLPSCLTWKKIPGKEIDHVVLGQGDVGGSWSRMSSTGCDDILTVSFAQWMQLPDCPVTGTKKGTEGKRINLGNVAKYYKSYIEKKHLEKYFRNHSTVTGLKLNEKTNQWKVTGWQEGRGHFEYITKRVVLATGNSDHPNRLNIDGEDLPFVFHSISDMDRVLTDAKNRNLKESVLIVGSGLTAADAILACKQYSVPVKHVFRRHPEDPALIFNQLPENLYPEYHMVHDSMKGTLNTPSFDYKTFPMHSVSEIRKNKEVVLTNLLGVESDTHTPSRTTIKVSYIFVLIGKRPDLTFIQKKVRDQLPVFPDEPLNPRSNPIRIQPFSHRHPSLPGLYAMGPLVGDNFVRFVQGAALAITNDIWQEEENKKRGNRKTCAVTRRLS